MLGLDFHVISIFCSHRTLYRIHTWELFVQNIRNMEYGKIFVHGKIKSGRRLVVAELYAGVQISNREVAVKQKFAKHDVKNEVSFSLCKYHIEIKKKKMRLQYTLLFPGNLDPSWLTPGDPIVLLVCGFRRRDSLLAWRELFANLYELKSRIWFWGNTTTLSEFIWYIDLTGFRQISPEYPRNNGKRKCVGECWYFKYLSRGIHLRNTTSTFFATPTLDANISINNQNIEQAWHTFVDWCLVNKTVQPACAVASETR